MSCRQEILEAAQRLSQQHPEGTFSSKALHATLRAQGSSYAPGTIATHLTTVMRKGTQAYGTRYADLERVERGIYRLLPPLPES